MWTGGGALKIQLGQLSKMPSHAMSAASATQTVTYEFSQRNKSSHSQKLSLSARSQKPSNWLLLLLLLFFFFRQRAHGKTEQKAELETINKREFCAALISRFASGGRPT